MIKCPICNNQIEISKLCPKCGAELDYLETHDIYHDWEVLYITNNLIEAELIKGSFESVNFPIQILSQQDSMRMFTVGDLSIIKIMTPTEFIEEARLLLIDLLSQISEENND